MIDKVRSLLKEQDLDAVLISSYHNILYLSEFSGFIPGERDGFLLITLKDQFIITSSLYTEAVLTQIPHFQLIEISSILPFSLIIKNLIAKCKIKSFAVEENDLTVAEFKKIKGLARIKDFSLSKIRTIKTPSEIEKIRAACKLGDLTFKHMLKVIVPGKSEKGLGIEMEMFIKSKGGEFSFYPIIAFNEHASMPHHKNTDTILKDKPGQLVLMDFGVKIDGYCSDMTRVVFSGKASDKQKKVYQTVLAAQTAAAQILQSQLSLGKKASGKAADEAARGVIKKSGFPEYGHSLGHGIGLQVHEYPRLFNKIDDELKAGMVFSIEPGIYLPKEFGVRIEDLYRIDGNKLIQLTWASIEITELR